MSSRITVELSEATSDRLRRLADPGETPAQTLDRLLFAMEFTRAHRSPAEPKPGLTAVTRRPRPERAGPETVSAILARYRERFGRDWPGTKGAVNRIWVQERGRLLPGKRVTKHNSDALYNACLDRMARSATEA